MFKPDTFDEPVESPVRFVEETDPEDLLDATYRRLHASAERVDIVFFALPVENNPTHFSYTRFYHKQLQMHEVVGAKGENDPSFFRKLLDWIACRQIDLSQMCSHRLSLKDVSKALLRACERDEGALKVTLNF